MQVAIITGASRGLGLALAKTLADRGWALVIDARGADALAAAEAELASRTTVRAIAGDVTDPVHRRALVTSAVELGGIDALVNNASYLGPSPQPELGAYPLDAVRRVYDVNVFAPLALVQEALPAMRPGGRIVNITSDAAVEAYEGWGTYGASKAALDQLTTVLAAEEPGLAVYAVDPGDMRTEMHQAAFPGEDISGRPAPEAVVPALLQLIAARPPSGRLRAAHLTEAPGSARASAGAPA
jgi:NAD(P)-dependent dehydrogenase (short-subunit alcohol dehydrogenase family)